MKCAFCAKKIDIVDKVERGDTCPHCGGDLRCCKQCNFYQPNAYNECLEVMAERVVDKERANFCDYYLPRNPSQGKVNRAQNARDALEALFKK
ncbi:MAG: hypothetical protein DRH37_02400 [Deltaproteobacteria bacterium]|nr:MAG: hypothetical protein DRH37_02400 [Deltaproteobacteria bacterium]